jgi:hypothetical protein
MTATENLIVLAIAVSVAYMVGKSRGQMAERAAKGACTCPDSQQQPEDAPSSMGWFANWSGLK